MHARVAFFRLRSGSFEQVVEAVQAPGGLLEIFRGRPGFESYELIETGAGLVSVSHWHSHEQADIATDDSAEWVADNIDHLIRLVRSDTGEVLMTATATAVTP
jgi:hypothetical protein